MTWIVEFGFAIGLLINALLFIPQITVILKTKSVKGVSFITFFGFNLIQFFTMMHGFIAQDYILAFGYLLSILTCGTVTFLIIYFRFFKKGL